MELKNTAQLELHPAASLGALDRLLGAQRGKMFDAFLQFMREHGGTDQDTVLDVCAHSSAAGQSSSCLKERADPQLAARIHTCTVDAAADCSGRAGRDRQKYQRADGRQLLFADGEFDWVFCGEIIEHAGSVERQYELLLELSRVARKGVFVTTPNRWHPLEFHTALPMLHWLPKPWWRKLLKVSGKGAWASESVLNLVGSRELARLSSLLPGKPDSNIGHVRMGGPKAHFFLMVRKGTTAEAQKKAA